MTVTRTPSKTSERMIPDQINSRNEYLLYLRLLFAYDLAKTCRQDLILATGRSDYPNQINNLLAFPGVFRGALDARASDINQAMKVAAAVAIAQVIPPDELTDECFVASALDPEVAREVAAAVASAAMESGVARTQLDLSTYRQNLNARIAGSN